MGKFDLFKWTLLHLKLLGIKRGWILAVLLQTRYLTLAEIRYQVTFLSTSDRRASHTVLLDLITYEAILLIFFLVLSAITRPVISLVELIPVVWIVSLIHFLQATCLEERALL